MVRAGTDGLPVAQVAAHARRAGLLANDALAMLRLADLVLQALTAQSTAQPRTHDGQVNEPEQEATHRQPRTCRNRIRIAGPAGTAACTRRNPAYTHAHTQP